MKLFLMVIGMVFFVEGLPYFISPKRMRQFIAQMQELPDEQLRFFGFLAMAVGLFITYLGKK